MERGSARALVDVGAGAAAVDRLEASAASVERESVESRLESVKSRLRVSWESVGVG